MQFTYPELLWALLLLLIPILVHLFQLRRFKKTPFTNVRLLKKVVAQSRHSRSLKKWLLLLTRLLLIAALVVAFAKPYLAAPEALTSRQQVIYLDNSFSMQAGSGEGSLIAQAIQDLLAAFPEETIFTLFTNDRVYEQVGIRDIRNELLALPQTYEQLDLGAVRLKGESLFSSTGEDIRDLILISDFQERMQDPAPDTLANLRTHYVQLMAENPANASVDSAFISRRTPNTFELTALLSRTGELDNLPVSLYNGDTLIAKTSAVWQENNMAAVLFTLPVPMKIEGRIEISDSQLEYDNQLYFTAGDTEKIKVLAIGNPESDFLGRIFTPDEFSYNNPGLETLNYSEIGAQNLLILNELETIPPSLQNAVTDFVQSGGSLAVIPSSNADLPSYDRLLQSLGAGNYGEKITTSQAVTQIAFSNPLFDNVFEGRVTNFQYPSVQEYFPIKTQAPGILSFQGGEPFLAGTPGLFVFSAPLSGSASNFRNSPLIVPTFYNMGVNSLKLPRLYYELGQVSEVDVPVSLMRDRILRVRQGDYEFIPQQQSYANKTTLRFSANPDRDGNFVIAEDNTALKRLSFNYDRAESKLRYLDPNTFNNGAVSRSVAGLFRELENAGQITSLWKWFVILALLCVLAELLIQKLLK